MTKKILPNLDKLNLEFRGRTLYGGSQQMYPKWIQRLSGCGPTTASNLFLYLGQTKEEMGNIVDKHDANDVLDIMETVWKYITPGRRGVDSTDLLVRGAEVYLTERKISLDKVVVDIPNNKQERPSPAGVAQMLEERIEDGFPIAFLNLDPGKVRNLYGWHWMLIVGIEHNNHEIDVIVYDEGVRRVIDLSLWLETTRQGGGFVSFSKKLR